MFFIAFLLAFFFVDGQSNERIYPSNTAVVSGKQFSLVCENYSGGITTTWKFLRVGTYADRVIYNGTHILDEFRSFQVHSTADGLSNLTKPIASMDDAGKYKCIHKHGSDYDVNSAEVIVFATDPVCSPKETNVMEGQFLEINCSGHYIGSISPIMKWTMGDGIDSNFDAIIANVSSIFFVISSLKMNATRIYNKVTFQCTTYFNQPIISNESQTSVRKAINAPTYEHQSTHRLNVLYEPDAVEIIPIKEVYTLGDVLLCSANGNPTPTYEWTELGSNRVVSRESYLTVDSIAMENQTYNCTANNNATGKGTSVSTTVTILDITLPALGSPHAVLIITTVACVICGILIVMIFIVAIKRFKVLERLSSFMKREDDYRPDIVQYANENVNGAFSHNERPLRETFPVYAEVPKKSSERAICFQRASSASKAADNEVFHESETGPTAPAWSKKQIIGADGTEYMDISEVRSVARFGAPSLIRPPLFEESQYAEIDHTKSF